MCIFFRVCSSLSSFTPAILLASALAPPLQADEAVQIFSGKNLDGWVVEERPFKDKSSPPTPNWQARDGILTCEGKTFGFLRYEKPLTDFAFHVEVRLSPRGNTGIGIRVPPYDPKRDSQTRASFASYEVQLQDDAGKPATKHSTGSLYRYAAPTANPVRKANEWNAVDVECVGPRIRITINGEQVLDVDQSTIAEIQNKPLKGFVSLQSHSNKVEFRSIRLREIKATASK